MDLSDVQLGTFEPLVGDLFVADFGDEGTVELELVVARPLTTGNEGVMAFSIEFRGPSDRVFEQCTVPLTHAELGRLDLFLVPVQQDEFGRVYESVFTRLLD